MIHSPIRGVSIYIYDLLYIGECWYKLYMNKNQNNKDKLEAFNKRYEYAANILNGKISLKEAINWMAAFIKRDRKTISF